MANTITACQAPPAAKTRKFEDFGSRSTAKRSSIRFLQLDSCDLKLAEKVKKLSQRMKKPTGKSLEELEMVDTIQRLGIDHLFQQEVIDVLHQHHLKHSSKLQCRDNHDNGLYEVSLRFRLLRQGGYRVSAHTFEEFLQEDGMFKQDIVMDTRGIVGLFEASQMSIQGETILGQAEAFSKEVLNASLEKLDESEAQFVRKTLKHPFRKSLARFTASDFLSSLSNKTGWRTELQEIMKAEFSLDQTVYQNEILHISKWWKKLGLANQLKFARNQPLKWHMWSLAMLPDPSFSEQRLDLTKPISFIYIIDDIFDVYGTPEDLALFTEAVNRWEFETLEMLPEYMKVCLKALFDVTDEISNRIQLKYGYNPKHSLQKAWADLCNAFLAESKWFKAGHLPTAAEYLKIGTISSGVHIVLVHLFFLLGGAGQVDDKDYTRIISSTAMILRLWDDLGSSEDEDQDGHDGSYIKCYMNEEEGVTIENARERVIDLISDAWKRLNEESLQSSLNAFSANYAFTRGCLNLARMVPLMYSHDENHKLPDLQRFTKAMLNPDPTTATRPTLKRELWPLKERIPANIVMK